MEENSRKNHRIILEGSPGGFKSRIIKELSYYSIPEIIDTKNYPPEDKPLIYDSKKEQFFIKNELKKYSLYKKSPENIILQDRDYTSINAYNYARMKLYGETNRYKKIKMLINTLPNQVRNDFLIRIVIIVKPRLSIKRKREYNQQSLWRNPSFIKFFNESYNGLKNTVFVDGNKSYSYVKKKVIKIINHHVR